MASQPIRATHDDGALAYARRLASYMADANYIRALTVREFGRSPSVDAIEATITFYRESRERFAQGPQSKNCQVVNDNGEEFRVRSLLPRAPKSYYKPRPKPARPVLRKWPGPVDLPLGIGARTVALVARDFYLSPEDITGKARTPYLVDARAVVARLLRDRGWSYPKIGAVLDRDHSTVMNLLNNFDIYERRNSLVRESYDYRRGRNG